VKDALNTELKYYVVMVGGSESSYQSEIGSIVDTSNYSSSEPDAKFTNAAKLSDVAMLIYTSGTTGIILIAADIFN
jgi:long-subunit acyl-CoA synthetase (AMP-forming)